jgi:hypothetical protein
VKGWKPEIDVKRKPREKGFNPVLQHLVLPVESGAEISRKELLSSSALLLRST